VLRPLVRAAGLEPLDLPADLRVRRRGGLRFAFNFGPETIDLAAHLPIGEATAFRLGSRHLPSACVAAWAP
jgi:beta-galactosidase